MAYERINWQNGEVGNTPLNANNLNRMDMTIEEHEQKIGDHDYEIENLKTGAQGITEEINKKMDRINPQGSGTFSIQAVNADNITAQTVETDELKVTKVGSKGGTAPVVFDNDILVSGITTPIGSLASSANSKAESANERAENAYNLASRANREAASAINKANENRVIIDKHTGLIGEGVGDKEPIFSYLDGYYIAPNGSVTQYNATAKIIEIPFLNFIFSGDNIIFNHVDLLPTENCIPCAWYDISGNFISAADGLNIIAEIDEQTFKITKQYIDYCIIPVPAGASSCKLSGLANGSADIRIQTSLSEAIKDLQSKPEPVPLVLTNPSPLPATDGKKIIGIDAKGNSTQNGTPTPTSPIPIIDASGEVVASTKNLFDKFVNTPTGTEVPEVKLKKGTYTVSTDKAMASGNWYIGAYSDTTTCITESAISASGMTLNGNKTRFYGIQNAETFTFTLNTDAYIVLARLNANNTAKAQIELGTTATSYVPYQSNSIALPYTLKSVGNVADELVVNEDGSGKKKVNVYEFVPNAQNCVDATPLQGDGCKRLAFKLDHLLQTGVAIEGLSNMYSNIDTSTYSALKYGQMSLRQGNSSTSYVRLTFPNECTTTAECLAYLTDCKIYYPLPTPIETPLTAEQVASIRQLQTYKGTTVIDSEMQIDSVTYAGDIKAYIDYRIEQIINPTALSGLSDIPDEEVTEE